MNGRAAWVDELMAGGFDDSSGRVVAVECDEYAIGDEVFGRVTVTFTIEDFRGDTVEVHLADAAAPTLLRENDKSPALYVLMPMRV